MYSVNARFSAVGALACHKLKTICQRMHFNKPDVSFGHGEINQERMPSNMLMQHCVAVKTYKYVAAELSKGPGKTCCRDDKRQEECYTERWRDFHRRVHMLKHYYESPKRWHSPVSPQTGRYSSCWISSMISRPLPVPPFNVVNKGLPSNPELKV